MQGGEEQQKVILQAETDIGFVEYLATNEEELREYKAQHGLSVAIQRGRKEDLDSLQTIPPEIDCMIVPLRNNLIHLVTDGPLLDPVPMPEGQIISINELRSKERLVRTLVPWIIELINTVYAGQVDLELSGNLDGN